MKKRLILLAFVFLGRHAYADLSGGGLTDYYGNGVTSESFSGTRNPLDVETIFGGSAIDPRTRQWTLSYLTDSVVANVLPDQIVTGTVTAQDTASTSSTGFNGQVFFAGTPTAGSSAMFGVATICTGMVQITGTWTGTLTTEISVDGGVTWITHSLHQVGSASYITTYTSNFVGSLSLAAKNFVRIRSTAPFTGTANVRIIGSLNVSNIYVGNAVKILDGSSQTSSTTLSIAPASTPALVSNTAVVVGLSPNSPLPAGTSSLGQVTANAGTNLNTSALNLESTQSSFKAANHTDLTQVDTDLLAFKTSNHTDLGTVNTSVIQVDTDLNSFKSANHTDIIGTQPRNVTEIAGNAINTGIGAAGTGTQRVSVSNDSLIKLWDGTNTGKVVAGSTQAALTDTAVVVTGRPDNVGTPTQTSVSCAATSTTVLAANTATMFVSIRNPTTSTVTIWLNVAGAAAVAAAPSLDIPPGSTYDAFAEGASFLATSQINCISSGAASSVTVVYK